MCDNELAMRACKPIPEGTPPLTGHDLEHRLEHAEGWRVVSGQLERSFEFEDHYQAMAFVNAVAWVSHREDHHPEMVVGYNTVVVRYSTHTVDGLSENDFVCAAKLDLLISN